MTAEHDLLPLPDWMECLGEISAADIRDYARDNVAHATALLQAEIEALRAEVGETKEGAVRAMRQRDDQYNRAERLAEALALLPDDSGMIEHSPEEGPFMFCCGREVTYDRLHGPICTHDED